jgi:imidazolonepropionase-like amidohydrolase
MRLKAAGLIIWACLSAITARCQVAAGPQVIRDVRVFDGERVLEHRSVLVENGKISRIGDSTMKVPKAAEVVDGVESTLLPGLIDSHVHIVDQAEEASRQALVVGVTTQLDMFSGGERLKRIKKVELEDRPDLADVRTAGVGATVPGGHPTQMGGPSFPTVTKRVAMLDNATMRALIEAAHKREKLAVVHALSEQQARDAIAAGADGLVHMFAGESVGADFGEFAASHHVFVIPTLSVVYLDCGRSQGPNLLADPHLGPYIPERWRRSLEMAKPDPSKSDSCKGTDEGLHQLLRANVPLLAGTDSPAPGTTYGASLHSELALLVRDGLTPTQALAAATSVPARSFHLQDRGWIRAGMRADLLLVKGDPTKDILATRNIVAVWKRGVRVQR